MIPSKKLKNNFVTFPVMITMLAAFSISAHAQTNKGLVIKVTDTFKLDMKRILFILFLTFYSLTNTAFAGYSYLRAITVNASQISGGVNLTQFPILVCGNASSGACTASVSNMATVANGGNIQNTTTVNSQTVPADLIFTTDAGCSNLLTWQMANYNASTGEFEAWVTNTSTPLSYSSNTTFYMCYGNSAISSFQSTSTAVWDSNYMGVWHLNETSNPYKDSTSYGYNSTSGTYPTLTTAQIGGGQSFNGSTNSIIGSSPPVLTSLPCTISAWVYPTGWGTGSKGRIYAGNNGPSLWLDNSNITKGFAFTSNNGTAFWDSNTNVVSLSAWQYLVVTFDGSNIVDFYINGTAVGTANAGGYTNTADTSFYIGDAVISGSHRYFQGTLNEVRISKSVRTAGWVTTEYNNQSAPSNFYTMGVEQRSNALVGWWKFDENTGTTTADSSGNNNTGTLVSSPSWGTGKYGSALTFNGSNYNYVTIPISSSLNLTSAGTLALWEKTSATATGYETLAGNVNWWADYAGFDISLNSSGGFNVEVADTSGGLSEKETTPSQRYDDQKWHHLVFSWSGIGTNTGKLYADGLLVDQFNITNNAVSNVYPFSIGTSCGGCNGTTTAHFFTGTIDDVRVYNRALTAGEVYELYEEGGQTHMGTDF